MNDDSLTRLFNAEREKLLQTARRVVGCPTVAEDVVQDTLLKLWGRGLGEQDRGLLHTTARNLALDHLRARRVREAHAQDVAAQPLDRTTAEPIEDLQSQEALAAYVDALSALPERVQRVFLLNRLDGLTYRRIAKQLGVSVSTVEKDMIRALTVCRQRGRRRRDEE
jgi:RNA polymerase sigma-70 factor (ECF subfamily)